MNRRIHYFDIVVWQGLGSCDAGEPMGSSPRSCFGPGNLLRVPTPESLHDLARSYEVYATQGRPRMAVRTVGSIVIIVIADAMWAAGARWETKYILFSLAPALSALLLLLPHVHDVTSLSTTPRGLRLNIRDLLSCCFTMTLLTGRPLHWAITAAAGSGFLLYVLAQVLLPSRPFLITCPKFWV